MPESSFNKVLINFVRKETLAQVFPVNFAKFLKTPFLQNTSEDCFRFSSKCLLHVLKRLEFSNIF